MYRSYSLSRFLWLLLAESEKELGVPISDEQLDELRAHLDDIDFEAAERYEREVRHDVMAHILCFGDCCPAARPILHLGATSCYVGDNTDILNMRDGLLLRLALGEGRNGQHADAQAEDQQQA